MESKANKNELFKTELERHLKNELDIDFSVSKKRIADLEEFEKEIYAPFRNGKRIFYRGERIDSPSRKLIPTMFRSRNHLFKSGEPIININSDFLLDYYNSLGGYMDFYNTSFGNAGKYRMYNLCAFSQHYLDFSPFIDFTKSLYVALSFALKNRTEFDEDIIIYTVEIKDPDCCTTDMVTAECWVNDFRVSVLNTPEDMFSAQAGYKKHDIKAIIETIREREISTSPKAKLIDIPTNDLMKYQQGVFLLLTDYCLLHKSYLTKSIRKDFTVSKYIIDKRICKALLDMIAEEAPHYNYPCLLDIKRAAKNSITRS